MKNDEYYIFKGAKFNRLNFIRICIGVLFGFVGIAATFFLPLEPKSTISYFIIIIFLFLGYFVFAPKILRKIKRQNKNN